MAEKTLFQVWVDGDTAARVAAIYEDFGIDRAEFLRRAIVAEADRIEARKPLFPDGSPASQTKAR